RVGLLAQLGGLAVDGDPALDDQLLGLAPRGDAGAGEDLLQAFFVGLVLRCVAHVRLPASIDASASARSSRSSILSTSASRSRSRASSAADCSADSSDPGVARLGRSSNASTTAGPSATSTPKVSSSSSRGGRSPRLLSPKWTRNSRVVL